MAPTKRHSRGRGLLAVLACTIAAAGAAGAGASGDSLEYEVKAAMLYNFTRFVEWSPAAWKDAHSPLVVGVLGSDPFGRALDRTMQEKNYGGRPIQIRRLNSISEVEGCNVLFVSKGEKRHLADIVRVAQSSPILTVSDIDDFVRAGGIIGFVLVDGRIRFEINAQSAAKSGLTISSKLLRLAISADAHGGGN